MTEASGKRLKGAVHAAVLALLAVLLALGLASRADLFWSETPVFLTDRFTENSYIGMFVSQRSLLFSLPAPPPMFRNDRFSEEIFTTPVRVLCQGKPAWEGASSPRDVLEKGGGRWAQTDAWLLFSPPPGCEGVPPKEYRVRFPLRCAWKFILLTGMALALWILGRKAFLRSPPGRLALGALLACSAGLGTFLLLLNLAGLLLPLRGPEPTPDEAFQELTEKRMPYREALESLRRRPGEPEADYAERASQIVEKAMSAYFWDSGKTRYRLGVPLWENYILSLGGGNLPYGLHFFLDHQRALERGVGLDIQPCLVLAGFLGENGVACQIVRIGFYPLVQVGNSEDDALLLDPSLGLAFRQGPGDALRDPEPVLAAFRQALEKRNPTMAEFLTWDLSRALSSGKLRTSPPETALGEKAAAMEALAYRLKWPLSLALIYLGFLPAWLLWGRKGSGRSRRGP